MKKIVLSISTLLLINANADVLNKKGKYFFSWGYNTSVYSNSDIHLKGDNYDYTLDDVEASDRPTEFGVEYFTDLTIPQWNLKIGYYLDNTSSINFEIDHMKYVVDTPQTVKINGTDHQGNSHNNDNIQLDNFLSFEHTDGLNYWSIAYNKYIPLYVNDDKTSAISAFYGVGAGILIPRSNVTLHGYSERKDDFRIAGYGADLQGGFMFDFLENYFTRLEVKGGRINMPNVSTSPSLSDKASHNFNFLEYSLSLGYTF